MSESITFKYTIKEEDYVRAIRDGMFASKLIYGMWSVFGAFALFATLSTLYAIALDQRTWLSLAEVILVFGGGGALLWGSYWFPPKWMVRGSPSIGIEEEVILFDEKITIQSDLGKEDLLWAHFKKVDETDDFFLLHPHDGNCYPLPKQYFKDSAELDRFRQRIRDNIRIFREH